MGTTMDSKSEKIFNIFLNIKNGLIISLGAVCHENSGNDESKTKFLKQNVEKDLHSATNFSLPEIFVVVDGENEIVALSYDLYLEKENDGLYMHVFENIFKHFDAPFDPLICVTCVVDGKITIDGSSTSLSPSHPLPLNPMIRYRQPNWFTTHSTEEGFDLLALLNNDFLEAIKLLYNDKMYASALKLKMSFIDTVAFLEYGDIVGNFMRWIEEYCDLSSLNITVAEVWELRNSILHMTNANSRKVSSGSVRQIGFYVSGDENEFFKNRGGVIFFNFWKFILIISKGLEKWNASYNNDISKRTEFVNRYNLIISDSRYEIRIV
jgi:hypothetical protein